MKLHVRYLWVTMKGIFVRAGRHTSGKASVWLAATTRLHQTDSAVFECASPSVSIGPL
jgi:hypothetical protein